MRCKPASWWSSVVHDYGTDLEMVTFNKRGEVEEGKVIIQLKATDRFRTRASTRHLRYRIARVDLARWFAEPFPVLLIVYDAKRDRAYWLYVQSYFRT